MMSRNWKKMFALLVITAITVSGGGSTTVCWATEKTSGEEKEEDVKLRLLIPVWDDIRKDIASKIKEDVKTVFPDYEIEIEEYADNDKLRTYNATSDLPDVYFSGAMTDTMPIIEAEHSLDLLEYVTEDNFLDNYTISSVVEPWTDGRLYTLCAGADTFYTPRIFVNKDVFEECGVELPKTFDDLLAACKVFSEKGITPITSQTLNGQAVGMMLWQNFAAAEDPQTVIDFYNGKIGFTDEKVIAAFDKIDQLAKANAFMDGCTQMDYGANVNLFKSKGAAMYIMFTWALADFEDDPEIDFIPWPTINEEVDTTNNVQAWGGPLSGYGVSADTEFPHAAIKLAEFCVEEEAKYMNEVQHTKTAFDTGIEITGLSDLMQKNLSDFEAAENKLPSVQFIYSSEVYDEMLIQGGKLLLGEYSAQEACEALEKVRTK